MSKILFTWNTTETLVATGNLAPTTISGNLEQSGKIYTTIDGYKTVNIVWSKWTYNITWTQTLNSVGDKLEEMLAYDGIIYFTDTTIGNFSFELTDDSLVINRSDFGVCDISATFKEH